MSNIIAIDTAMSACSVALSRQGIVTVLREHKPRQHIQLILPMIDELLKQSCLSIRDIDAIGFSQGPGSFTGLRIGMGVVQGLAFGGDIQVVPVSTLQVMAQVAIDRDMLNMDGIVMPVIDARMDEVYWGIYKNNDGGAQPVCVDALNTPEQVSISGHAPGITDNIDIGVGDGWRFRDRISVQVELVDEQLVSDAEQVLGLSVDRYARGLSVVIDQIEPLYLRNQISWKKRPRLRKPTH
ncbi:MAG: tRNA (adenosine(37)-N6)-threonylcarbamoyltransferase complex dimerization subunit type 1 TsaB [Gammaproteobacteria bacterium]|nr:MAG: tRNA (adenosine(37)-N6)-threonylcarbamoyltransferase complex dimerization subunit type 1 TsaB [Gammaproteobacteria bacterium]